MFLKQQIQRNTFAIFNIKTFSTLCQNPHSCINSYNISKLLSILFKSGRVTDAENLFEKLPQKNIVSWSIAIHGYAINGFHKKSIKLFSQMRNSGLAPNSFSVVGALLSAIGLCDLMLASSIHGLILKRGLVSDFIVGTAMLDAYAKCGNALESYKVFKELNNAGLITCNATLAGLIANGLCIEGFMLFKEFRKFGLVPNVATVLTLIKGCVALEIKMLCESVYGLIFKFGLSSDVNVNNSVVNMYSRFQDLNAAAKVFDEMKFKDVISWTTMMAVLVDLECASDALVLLSKMKDSMLDLDSVVLMHLISACAILGDLGKGRQCHAQAVIRGFKSELPLVNSIIAMYSKCGDLRFSRIVFDQTTEKSLVSWTAMVSGCVQNGCSREALDLAIKARLEENYSFDSVMLVNALTASSELVDKEFCQQLHCYILETGFSQYRLVQNSLISAYSKCGNIDLAHIVFKEMDSLQNVVSWNAIINGYGINGHGEVALALYHEMRKGGEDPDSATYSCILSACSHAGLIRDGLMIFNRMVKDNKIRPSQQHYGCVIDLLMRAGCLSDTNDWKFLEDTCPNVWKALLSGCALHGNVELAELAAKYLLEKNPGESVVLVLLSNVYVSVGRFQDAESLRLTKGFVKNPGISYLCGTSYDCG
ncbi:pentatricopeptide repeat-containing protein At4g13650 [Ricinus communis]|uniref:pentatricopeptide repeat-containing protein At4g13650 n=1 Tax=Ricinus communis TaxID=3988 RepID=UPI00201A50F9|nr:pentatricopeptide repeat-containing protein At4g13650 [Ricinus communis]